MEEIRFSQSPRGDLPKEAPDKKSGFPNSLKMVLKSLGLVVVLILIVYGIFLVREKLFSKNNEIRTDAYSAIFLTNGQVYFGRIVANSSKEMVLNNVYYLQTNAPQGENALSQSTFSLVKLGNEVHGPTDELFVNRDQIIFYEYLRADSKLVESIRNYK